MERYTFNMRGQQHGENFDSFYMDIRNLSKDCEYGTLRDSLIRDRIVCGIQSGIVRARLLRDKELTLTKAIDACRAAEVSDQHLKALGGDPDKTVNAVKKPGQRVTQKHRNASSRSHIEHLIDQTHNRGILAQISSRHKSIVHKAGVLQASRDSLTDIHK